MEPIEQTIAAVCTASPVEGAVSRSILRISGPEAFGIVTGLCRRQSSGGSRFVVAATSEIENGSRRDSNPRDRFGVDGNTNCAGLIPLTRRITPVLLDLNGVTIDAEIYAFPAPHSYTGQDVVELHFMAPPVVVEALLARILRRCRQARPGEFTLRAFLFGRMDLTQAEAVAQVIAAGNRLQLEAAGRMFRGHLSQTLNTSREKLLWLLGEIEAGLDFSTEDIFPLPMDQVVGQIAEIGNRIQSIVNNNIQDQEMMDLPSVGLAGLPNAGKSSLMNALLGRPRSLVSPNAETTRDVLEAEWTLPHGRCVLFDCAGLLCRDDRDDILASLAQRAAHEALQSASVIVFCVDGSKSDWSPDLELLRQMAGPDTLLVMTQQDRWARSVRQTLDRARKQFNGPVLAVSAETGFGIEELRNRIDATVLRWHRDSDGSGRMALTQRHRLSMEDAIRALSQARGEILAGNSEVAAMLIRSAIEQLGRAESDPVDERVLDRIFSRFCIGK